VLNARLFAALAGIALLFAFMDKEPVFGRANLLLSVGRFAFGPFYWQLFVALICAVFALAYFGVLRLTQRPANKMVGLVSVFLVAGAFVVWLISSFVTTSGSPPGHRLLILLFAAIFSFLLGLVLSAANIAWVLFRR